MAEQKKGSLVPASEAETTVDRMGLREFAVTASLDCLYEAGLAVTVLPFERTFAEWCEELEAFKNRPVRNA